MALPEGKRRKSLDEALTELSALFALIKIADFPKPKEKILEIKSTATIQEAADILVKTNILACPVVDVKAKKDADWTEKYLGLVDMLDVCGYVMGLIEEQEEKEKPKYSSLAAISKESKKLATVTVAEIYGKSGGNPFVPLESNSSLRDLMLLLGKHHIYRIPVIDGQKQELTNLITQSALVSVLASKVELLGSVVNRTLESLGLAKQKKLFSVGINEEAKEAFKIMVNERISAVPVLGVDGKLIGNVSARDLRVVLSSPSLLGELSRPLSSFLPLMHEAEVDIMAPGICCGPEVTLAHVIKQLALSRIHRIYIVDRQKKLINVVTLTDVIRTLIKDEPLSPPAKIVAKPAAKD